MSGARRISYEESLSVEGGVYIDVRSPSEFARDSIPGSVNLPVFDDGERSEVGTLYRRAGRGAAVIRGTEIGGAKISSMIKVIAALNARALIFVCARGGMRSGSVAAIAASLGFETYAIERGYRDYRLHVMGSLESLGGLPPLYVIQGLTGSGKTEMLRIMENAVDLEAMAGHRSSIFGGIGAEPKTQKSFETELLGRLKHLGGKKFIVAEGESRKIGNLHIHPRFFGIMRGSPQILLTTPIEARVNIILREYAEAIDCGDIEPIVKSLSAKLGVRLVDELLSLRKGGRHAEFVALLLEKYYDPLYMHTMGGYNYIFEIEWAGAEKSASLLEEEIARHGELSPIPPL